MSSAQGECALRVGAVVQLIDVVFCLLGLWEFILIMMVCLRILRAVLCHAVFCCAMSCCVTVLCRWHAGSQTMAESGLVLRQLEQYCSRHAARILKLAASPDSVLAAAAATSS